MVLSIDSPFIIDWFFSKDYWSFQMVSYKTSRGEKPVKKLFGITMLNIVKIDCLVDIFEVTTIIL